MEWKAPANDRLYQRDGGTVEQRVGSGEPRAARTGTRASRAQPGVRQSIAAMTRLWGELPAGAPMWRRRPKGVPQLDPSPEPRRDQSNLP